MVTRKKVDPAYIVAGLIALMATGFFVLLVSLESSDNERAAAAAVAWRDVDGVEITAIQTLPGYSRKYTQNWYAVARVQVNGVSRSVRLPDDAVVMVGDTITVWINSQTGEVLAEPPTRSQLLK